MYRLIEKLHTLYGLLRDQQSKELFLSCFAVDMEPSVPNLKRLVALGSFQEQGFLGLDRSRTDALRRLNKEHKEIILYGTAQMGRLVARLLEFEHIGFYGFCGRGAERYPDGLLGKPVLSPDELAAHGDRYYVLPAVTTKNARGEILQFLKRHNYPEDRILDWVSQSSPVDEKQYFEFPELYRRGTAFIDGGCYDCASSYRFAEWCGGEYSSIIAFEPDPDNYAECCKRVQDVPLPNFQLVNAGLSGQEGTAVFTAQNGSVSHITYADLSAEFHTFQTVTGHDISIRTVALDDIVGERTVGFIKMDIEGAEFDALHGAEKTILRDRPLLAICVYHLRGDLFAIMDHLHRLLPEYRFLLRHYGTRNAETVLYASVDL